MTDAVSADEFARQIERYREQARNEPVAVSVGGTIAGYFVSPDAYEAFRRHAGRRASFATEELPDDLIKAIMSSRMDERRAHLDAMLDPE